VKLEVLRAAIQEGIDSGPAVEFNAEKLIESVEAEAGKEQHGARNRVTRSWRVTWTISVYISPLTTVMPLTAC
jgi:hypothetical protein